jgi:hypothetical protein
MLELALKQQRPQTVNLLNLPRQPATKIKSEYQSFLEQVNS